MCGGLVLRGSSCLNVVEVGLSVLCMRGLKLGLALPSDTGSLCLWPAYATHVLEARAVPIYAVQTWVRHNICLEMLGATST